MKNNVDINGLNKCREQTINDIIDLLKTNNKVACNRYTGFGKSYYVVRGLIDKLNSNVLIVVPNEHLISQYKSWYINDNNVEVISYQSIRYKSDEYISCNYRKYKYIICDECHHLGNNKWKNEFERLNNIVNAKVIGFTATPVRGDGVNVIKTYFNNVQVAPMELIDGIGLNFTSKIQYVVAYAEIDDKYDSRLSDIDRYEIKNLLNISNIIKKYIEKDKLNNNLKVLVFVSQVKFIKEAIEQCKKWFNEAYPDNIINIYDIHSYKSLTTNRSELNEFKKDHNNNVIDIMISVDKLIEGLHLPTVNIEIMLRKTKSPVTYFQQLGRVINSDTPVVFDLINNSSHLYQMRKEYNVLVDMSKWGLDNNREKVMFDECVILRDEAKPIENILQRYIIRHKTPKEIIDEIDNKIKENLKYLQDNNGNMTMEGVINYLDIPKHCRKYMYYELLKFGVKLKIKQSVVTKYVDEIFNTKLDEIIENKDGLTYTGLADKYNIKKSTFIGRIKRYGIEIKNIPDFSGATDMVKDNLEYIIKNPDKLNKKQLADKLGISESAFQSCLHRLNITPNNVNEYSNKLRYANEKAKVDDNIEYIKEELKTKSLNEVSVEFNLPAPVLSKYLKDKYNYVKDNGVKYIDYIYVQTNPDNLSFEELGAKFGFKRNLYSFKSRLIRQGIKYINIDGEKYILKQNVSAKYKKIITDNLDYILENKNNESCEIMGKRFGIKPDMFRRTLYSMNIPLPVKKNEMEIFIEEHFDYIQFNSMDYTPSGMAVHLMELFPEYNFSRSGLSERLRKIDGLTFKSK